MKSQHFSKSRPDLRSRASIEAYLSGHYRYNSSNSCGQASSYAHCVKIPRLPLTPEQSTKAYELLDVEDAYDFLNHRIHEFTAQHNGYFTAGTNGRSGGYIVMYESAYKDSQHKSRCTRCGQRNYQMPLAHIDMPDDERTIARAVLSSAVNALTAPEVVALALADTRKQALVSKWRKLVDTTSLAAKCGACHADARVPYKSRELSVWSGRGIDSDVDFSDKQEWSMFRLVERAKVVMSFDALCNGILEDLVDLVDSFKVVTKTIMVPTQVRVLEPLDA